jgi:hypothetical protein
MATSSTQQYNQQYQQYNQQYTALLGTTRPLCFTSCATDLHQALLLHLAELANGGSIINA